MLVRSQRGSPPRVWGLGPVEGLVARSICNFPYVLVYLRVSHPLHCDG
jgi:hypothetical protein